MSICIAHYANALMMMMMMMMMINTHIFITP